MKNPPAFPRALASHEAGNTPDEGMTLRDYFAAAALTGLLADSHKIALGPDEECPYYASEAYRFADAMLAAREEVKP